VYGEATYTPPSAKTIIKPVFCFFGNLSVDNAGIGSAGIAISVAMFMAAFPNQTGCSSKQYPLGIVLSQKYGIGLHMKLVLQCRLFRHVVLDILHEIDLRKEWAQGLYL
jgi:hypothetical protein